MESKKIKEIIIVEGKDDITKVKQALDAEVISTGGIHISKRRLKEIVELTKDRGAIILTDPDHAGNVIRDKLSKALLCSVKQAYIKRNLAIKNEDIGVENAKAEDIREAILNAHPIICEKNKDLFDSAFMFQYKLQADKKSSDRRRFLSEKLNLGNPNAKEMLRRLNSFAIKPERVIELLKEYEESNG